MSSKNMNERRRATRFFWCVLTLAACASIAGNVTHAILAAPAGAPAVAAAAVVPPAVLLAATHGVALLVRTRTTGATYWCALCVTVALALFALVLSFEALRALAVMAGYSPRIAWMWPLTIDLSIAQSTLALLALTRPLHHGSTAEHDDAPAEHDDAPMHSVDAPVCTDGARHAAADDLIGAGVTRLEREKVVAVLSELADGTAPSTVARRLNVGYTTVARIAQRDASASEPAGDYVS